MGQYDAKVASFKFYSQVIDILRQKAAHAPGGAIDVTEYIRRICLVDAYGVEHLAKLHRSQYEAVAQKGSERDDAA
jgi:hypothetical protein